MSLGTALKLIREGVEASGGQRSVIPGHPDIEGHPTCLKGEYFLFINMHIYAVRRHSFGFWRSRYRNCTTESVST